MKENIGPQALTHDYLISCIQINKRINKLEKGFQKKQYFRLHIAQ